VREGDRVVLREELHQTARKEVASRLGKEEGGDGEEEEAPREERQRRVERRRQGRWNEERR
jgi:hypothetical protein